MRLGLISDIHGNLLALDLVLADLQAARVDQILCLGDVASLGPQPNEVIARLRELDIPVLRGNHEAYLLNLELTADQQPWLRAVEHWCRSRLSDDEVAYLRSLPDQWTGWLEPGVALTAFHGSPRSNEEWLFPTTAPEQLDAMLAGLTAPVLAGGHTHVQMARPHRGAWVINPGSVGMPFEFPMRGSQPRSYPRAEYAILDMTAGQLTTELRRRPVALEALAAAARASDMPGAEHWLTAWTGG